LATEGEDRMANDDVKYYEDYILRKEGGKWIQYWVVIRGVWMLFYRDKATTNRDNFKGSIELKSSTKCNIARRGNYSFPFYLNTERGTHLFKCETNLKRHQWMYLIELASKGAPPIPSPLAIPSSTSVLIIEDLNSSETQPDHTDKPDSETDENDLSIPPGVILVTTPIDDLSHNEGVVHNHNNVMGDSTIDSSFLSRAVLSTGITGTTTVVQKPSSPAPKDAVKTSAPKLSRSFQHARGEMSSNRKSSNPGSFLSSLSPHSAHSWGRGSPDRPSTSPSSPSYGRKHSEQQLKPAESSRDNVRFSRHMVRSAPDIKTLSLEDYT